MVNPDIFSWTNTSPRNGLTTRVGLGEDTNFWAGHGTDTDKSSTHSQRFSVPIFADGFESGYTSAWSNTVQ